MPLEDLVGPNKYLDSLVREWPLGIDPFAEGDDHIRGVKNTILNSFPTVGEARYPVSFLLPPNGESEEKAGGTEIGVGTTAQRPTAGTLGALRWNTDTGYIEVWDSANWKNLIAMTALDNVFSGNNSFGGVSTFTALARLTAGIIAESTGAGLADLGPGTINAENGFYENGEKIGQGFIYETAKALSGTLVKLIDVADVPELADATSIDVISNAARCSNSSNPPRVRLSTAQSPIAAGYEGAASIISSGGSNVSSVGNNFSFFRGSSYTSNGRIVGHGRITRYSPTGNLYMWSALVAVGARTGHNACMVDIGAPIDAIYVQADSGTLAGEITVRVF